VPASQHSELSTFSSHAPGIFIPRRERFAASAAKSGVRRVHRAALRTGALCTAATGFKFMAGNNPVMVGSEENPREKTENAQHQPSTNDDHAGEHDKNKDEDD
jgi:hypothetical protein